MPPASDSGVRSTDSGIDLDFGVFSPARLFQADASQRSFALDPHGRFLIRAGQDKSTEGIMGST